MTGKLNSKKRGNVKFDLDQGHFLQATQISCDNGELLAKKLLKKSFVVNETIAKDLMLPMGLK